MKKELINNTHLQRLVALKSNKLHFEDVTEEEIESISDLSIHGKLINGLSSGIDLNESLELFPNLTSLILSDFVVTQEIVDKLQKLEKLEELEVVDCEFQDTDLSKLFEQMQIMFVGCKEMPFDIRNQRIIHLKGCNVDFKRLDISSTEELKLIACRIRNMRSLVEEEQLKTVDLNGSTLIDEEGKRMENVTVPNGCRYSHIEDITRVVDEK